MELQDLKTNRNRIIRNIMKKQERIYSVRFAGTGHYNVTIIRYNKLYTATTTDMQTIDDYHDGKVHAAINLYDFVISKTNPNRYN